MPRLFYISTIPFNLRSQIVGQLAYLREHGYEVTAVSNPEADLDRAAEREQVQAIGVSMQREIRPWADFISLWRMWRLMRQIRPHVVCAGTPKGALLGMLAAWATGVPARVYMLLGLRLETTRGWKRCILKLTERITAGCAQRVVCVSESLRQAYLQEGCTSAEKALVLGKGSHNGIDPNLFAPNHDRLAAAKDLRRQWGIPETAPIIGFVGRLVRDKGIIELCDAFELVLNQRPDAWLLLLGEYESGDPVPTHYMRWIAGHSQIVTPGFVRDLAPYYAAMTVVSLPSYREGFPNVVLQANSARLPVVGFRTTGMTDAVENGETGILVEMGDISALAEGLLSYLNDADLRHRNGQAAFERVIEDFRCDKIWQATDLLFRSLLNA